MTQPTKENQELMIANQELTIANQELTLLNESTLIIKEEEMIKCLRGIRKQLVVLTQ